MQIGRLVEFVIRGLDIAAVVAAHLQESAYVIVEIGQNSVTVLGVAGKIAIGYCIALSVFFAAALTSLSLLFAKVSMSIFASLDG